MHSLFTKFQGTYDVILFGDLNGTLLDRRSNKHDKLLKELTAELQLSTGIICGNKPTFHHLADTSKSQIDYILVQDKSLLSSYTILDKSPICSSAHAPVKAILTTAINGPRREKTCLRGNRHSEIQTSLPSYRDALENRNFTRGKFTYETYQKANNKGADQSARMRRLVCVCVVRKPPKTGFLALRPK